jgi:hypothetical protein
MNASLNMERRVGPVPGNSHRSKCYHGVWCLFVRRGARFRAAGRDPGGFGIGFEESLAAPCGHHVGRTIQVAPEEQRAACSPTAPTQQVSHQILPKVASTDRLL